MALGVPRPIVEAGLKIAGVRRPLPEGLRADHLRLISNIWTSISNSCIIRICVQENRMELFRNKQESNMRSAIKMVEKIIGELGLDPQETRVASPGDERIAWGFMKGSAEIYVTLKQDKGENYIRVNAPVITLPTNERDQLRLYRRLLVLNAGVVVGAAFGITDERVIMVTERSTIDLDESEVRDMIKRVGHYADFYDDALVSEFGGQRHTDVGRM